MVYKHFLIDFSSKDRFVTSICNVDLTNITADDFVHDYFYLRHDILHYAISDALLGKWLPERRVDKIFPGYIGPGSDQTPDIILQQDDDIYIIDVAVAADKHKIVLDKETKYTPLKIGIQAFFKNNNVHIIPLVYSPGTHNFSEISSRIQKLAKNHFDTLFITTTNNHLSGLLGRYCELYTESEFESAKKRYFQRNDESFYFFETGKIKDTKIDPEMLDKIYYRNYHYSLKIKKDYETEDFFEKFLEDDISKEYSDCENNPNTYNLARENIRVENEKYPEKCRPTIYFLLPHKIDLYDGEEKLFDWSKKDNHQYKNKSEQLNIINFFLYIKNKMKVEEKSPFNFILNLSKTFENLFVKSKNKNNNLNMFCEGDFFNDETISQKYHATRNGFNTYEEYLESKKKRKEKVKEVKMKNIGEKEKQQKINFLDKNKNKKISYIEYCQENDHLIKDDNDSNGENIYSNYYPKNTKTICLKELYLKSNGADNFYKTSGINFYKNDMHLEKKKKINEFGKSHYTCDFKKKSLIENFLKESCLEIDYDFFNTDINQYYNYCIDNTGYFDSDRCNFFRKKYTEEYQDFLREILDMKSTRYLWFTHLVYSQLMHMQSFDSKPSDFMFFNCGVPNFLCIISGGFRSNDTDARKAFMTMCITDKPEDYTEIYGNLHKTRLSNGYYLIMTGWRRLSLDKCTFCKDSFYSVISTTMSSYFDYPSINSDYLKELHCIKTLISINPSQKNAEILMDNRYAFMSSISTHTNIYKLLVDKFGPPYHDALTVWIIDRMFQRYPKITSKVLTNDLGEVYPPTFRGIRRQMNSYGGILKIESLWTNYIIQDVNQLLDEAFIYVHTIKEPASQFHEKIKAINTILDHQEEFDSLPDYLKYGWSGCEEDLFKFARDRLKTNIGFSSTIIYKSFDSLLNIIKPDFGKIIHNVLEEHLGEITTTKAVIHSLERKIVKEDIKLTTSSQKRALKRKRLALNDNLVELDESEKKGVYKAKNKSDFYRNKERQKVWETVLSKLMRNPTLYTVEDMVNDFFQNDNGKLEADICIKSQYGSKREFYVINIGAKYAARIVEKFFNELAKYCSSECISVPGDKKMLRMQQTLDDASRYANTHGLYLKYVNGDCTKWSAAETMGSFITMCKVLKKYIPKNFYKLLRTIFSLWANKRINIPTELIQKVGPLIDRTRYLRIDDDKKQLKSTQNFLQGMFNYASSIKSSSCSAYTNTIWKRIRPQSLLRCFHMEHSDDYVQIICYENEAEFVEYRRLHKLMMKLHGFNDSDRKTSCQTLFMEFVSLMSFNGQMLYPKIKKTKEINTNLPCTGYKADMEAALSRQGECVRMGCSLPYCYFFMKSHVYCLAEAYSLLPGMRNYFDNYKNRPIELFGLPDQLPIFSLLCKGNINNYRIYTYGNHDDRVLLSGLISLSQDNSEEVFLKNIDYDSSIFTPIFCYDIDDAILKMFINKLNIDFEEVKQYWLEHISYKFVKPKNIPDFIRWLKYKYLDKSFIEAYTMTSRTKMTMRLARYVSKKILKYYPSSDELYNMKDIYNDILIKIKSMNYDVQDRNKIMTLLTKSDPSVTTIYDIIEKAIIVYDYDAKKPMTRGTYTPYKLGFYSIENNPGILLQYVFNYEDFVKDKRRGISTYSLEEDSKIIKNFYKFNLEDITVRRILSIYNDLSTIKYKRVVMMGYNNVFTSLIDITIDVMTAASTRKGLMVMKENSVYTMVNPFTGTPYYCGDNYYSISSNQQCLENLCLIYTYLLKRYNYTTSEIIKFLNNIDFVFMDDKNNYKLKFNEVLRTFHVEYLKIISKPSLYKIACYLSAVLLGETQPLIDYVNNYYSYSYEYEKRAEKQGLNYSGLTICHFKYMNNEFTMKQMNEEPPLLLTTTRSWGSNKMAYLIALKLGNLIKRDTYLEKEYLNFNENKYIMEDIEKKYKNLDEDGYWFYKNDNNLVQVDYKNESLTKLPIKLVRKLQTYNLKKQKKEFNLIPTISEKEMCARFGRQKLYTLPFWKCRVYQGVCKKSENVKELRLEGVDFDYIITNSVFETMLHKENYVFTKMTKNDFLPTNEDIDFYKNYCNLTYMDNKMDTILNDYNEAKKEAIINSVEPERNFALEISQNISFSNFKITLPSDTESDCSDNEEPGMVDIDEEDLIDPDEDVEIVEETLIERMKREQYEVLIRIGNSFKLSRNYNKDIKYITRGTGYSFYIKKVIRAMPIIFNYYLSKEIKTDNFVNAEEYYHGREKLKSCKHYLNLEKDNVNRTKYCFLNFLYYKYLVCVNHYNNNNKKIQVYYDQTTDDFKFFKKGLMNYDRSKYVKYQKRVFYYDDKVIMLYMPNKNEEKPMQEEPHFCDWNDFKFINTLSNTFEIIDDNSDIEDFDF